MAKVSGPLFSQSASGKFGGALVFSTTKGRNVVRKLVKPSNPMTQNQMDVRNRQRVTGAAQKFVKACTLMGAGRTMTDIDALRAAAPSGFSWNGNLVKGMIGAGGLVYMAGETAFAALTSNQKTAWDAAAAALTPAIAQVAQMAAGNVAGTPKTAGEVWYLYQNGLANLGIASAPTGTPPTYA